MPTRIRLSWRTLVIPALCIALILAGAGCREAELVGSQSSVQQNVEPEIIEPLPQYDVVDTKDLSFSNCVRKQVTVRTAHRLSEAEITGVARSIVDKVTSEHKVNAVSIMMYDTPDTSGPYTLASVDWAPNGDWSQASTMNTGDYSTHRFTINMPPERPPEPKEIGGLPPVKAKQCFADICRAQDKAYSEAEARYPGSTDVMKQAKYAQTLSEQYEKAVREKYGITQKEQSAIVAAGVTQSWPMY